MEDEPEIKTGRWSQVYDRLTRVERDLTAIATGFDAVSQSLSRLETTQHELARIVNNRGRTDWAVVGTIAGAIAALLVFYTTLVTRPIEAEQDQARIETRYDMEMLHRATDIRIAALEAEADHLRQELSERTRDRYTREDHRQFATELNERLRDLRNGRD